jgi:acid phosphatase (class A)
MKSLGVLFLLLAATRILHAGEEGVWKIPSGESLLAIVPAPPQPGSPADKADLDAVMGLQATASKRALAHAQETVCFTVFTFSEVRGKQFTPEAFPQTAAFFKKLGSTINPPKNWLKNHYRRGRPYVAHPNLVKILVTPEGGYSWPSGHSLWSWVYALVLGELDPSHRSEYLGCAWRVNIDRVIGGMHYPSDTAIARSLAEALFADLMEDAAFRKELEDLKRSEY